MHCSHAQDQLSGLLDGTLAPEPAADLARHLVGCERCRAALLSARVPQHGLPVSGPDNADFWDPMDAAILAEIERADAARSGGSARWLATRVSARRSTLLLIGAAMALAAVWGYSLGGYPSELAASSVGAVRAAPPSPAAAARTPTAPSHHQLQIRPVIHVPAHGSL